jgi:hypothetical protein
MLHNSKSFSCSFYYILFPNIIQRYCYDCSESLSIMPNFDRSRWEPFGLRCLRSFVNHQFVFISAWINDILRLFRREKASNWRTQIEQITVNFNSSIGLLHYELPTFRSQHCLWGRHEKWQVIWARQILRAPFYICRLLCELFRFHIFSTHFIALNFHIGVVCLPSFVWNDVQLNWLSIQTPHHRKSRNQWFLCLNITIIAQMFCVMFRVSNHRNCVMFVMWSSESFSFLICFKFTGENVELSYLILSAIYAI